MTQGLRRIALPPIVEDIYSWMAKDKVLSVSNAAISQTNQVLEIFQLSIQAEQDSFSTFSQLKNDESPTLS